jgi:VanZ family protein
LIIGTSPVANLGWRGMVSGLAFYNRALSGAEVVRNRESWIARGRPETSPHEGLVALYTFDERSGSVARNQVAPAGGNGRAAPDLHIPPRYKIEQPIYLAPFWDRDRMQWGYFNRDVLLNIAGFVPFGFAVCAYFSLRRSASRTSLVTLLIATIIGALLSFAIESLQVFIPVRDSSSMDLITNTLGTGIGAVAYRVLSVDLLRGKSGMPHQKAQSA